MRRISSMTILFAFLVAPVVAQTNKSGAAASVSKDVVGQYWYSTGYIGAFFKIAANGKYEYSTFSDCCDTVLARSGSYALTGDVIHFKASRTTVDGRVVDAEELAGSYGNIEKHGPNVHASEFQSEYDLQVVRWGDRIYLIEPNGMNLFAAAVNFGIEPRQDNENHLPTSQFFLRAGYQNKAVTGKPALPERWMSFLPDTPIIAKVTSIDFQNQGRNYTRTYTIDKGSADGLQVGMLLLGEKAKIEYDNLLLVISVDKGSAKLSNSPIFRAANYAVGDVLVSRR